MQYEEALNYVHSLLTFGIRPGMERINALLSLLDNPQNKLKFIHVAGTNGKGSTCTMLSEICIHAGYKTGLFTSPYIIDFRERLQINGKMIEKEDFAELMDKIKPLVEKLSAENLQPTEFEVITAAAFLYFAEQKCDVVVLEVGLGGLLDSTNVIRTPLVSVIASVSMDHMNILGNTLGEIAEQKCGIIKENGVTVSYPLQQEEVLNKIRETSNSKNNKLLIPDMRNVNVIEQTISGTYIMYNNLELNIKLIGNHQIANCITAVTAVLAAKDRGLTKIDEKSIILGVSSARIPARMEVFDGKPLVILDGAHNADGIEVLAEGLKKYLSGRKIHAVMGMMADKEYLIALKEILPLCESLITTTPSNPRALSADDLMKCALPYGKKCTAINDPKEAYLYALKNTPPEDVLLVCGSLYLSSDVRSVISENKI